jgi:putative membrane protein
MGPWMMGGYGWGPWTTGDLGLGWVTPILTIIFLGLVIWGIVMLVRYIAASSNKNTSSALDTLKIRYAQGEISKAEYEEKRKDLI